MTDPFEIPTLDRPEPELTAEVVDALRQFGPDWDVDVAPGHGDALSALVGGFPEDWLSAAVLAGWVPQASSFPLALHARHYCSMEEIEWADDPAAATERVLGDYKELSSWWGH